MTGKSSFLNPDQIRVRTRNDVVTLEGLVRTETQKQIAEKDAWYVFGLDQVINHLQVRP